MQYAPQHNCNYLKVFVVNLKFSIQIRTMLNDYPLNSNENIEKATVYSLAKILIFLLLIISTFTP